MDSLRLDDLVRRTQDASGPCISIYLPTHRAGRETRQGPSRMKNAVREARQQAAAMGLDERALESVLRPAVERIDDQSFWQHQGDGLAVLLAPGFAEILRLPVPFEEFVIVADRLHLRPLLALGDDLEFLVLALSQNRVRLLRGNRSHIEAERVPDLPDNKDAALWMDDPEKSLQHHSYSAPQAQRTIYHGQGVGRNDEQHKQDLARFFRKVDGAIRQHVGDPPLPLLLACVDYYASLYREVSQYPELVAEAVIGNPDESSEESLHEQSWRILQPRLAKDRARAIAGYRELAGTGRTSDRLDEVVNAAANGRVRDLFVTPRERRWGRPSADHAAPPEVHQQHRPGDVDLLDVAAVATLACGGRVHRIGEDEEIGRGVVAATFRY